VVGLGDLRLLLIVDDPDFARPGEHRDRLHPLSRSSSSIKCMTALINAKWENACGKFPRWRPQCGSISSAYSNSGPAYDSNFSHSARACVTSPISVSAETNQNEQMVNAPSSPLKPSLVSSTR